MRYVVMGGGVAGVCCAEELCKLCHDDEVVLVSSYKTLKGVGNVVKYTDNLENFEIVERDLTSLPYANLTVQQGTAAGLSAGGKQVFLSNGKRLLYDKLCVCTGANPKAVANSPHVVVLRDQGTIEALAHRLPGKRRVVLVGNGGIALEVAHALSGVEVIWAVKHKHIEPVQPQQISQGSDDKQPAEATIKTQQGTMQFGHAVGPQWAKALPQSSIASHITLEYGVDVTSIQSHTPDDNPMQHPTQPHAGPSEHQSASQTSSDTEQQRVNSAGDQDAAWPVTVCLSNGKSYGADLVISAIGVEPNTGWLPEEVCRDESDGGIIVDRLMQSSVPAVYAAGDACTIAWTDQSPHWFQMRLWTQARIQGMFAAHAMAGVTDEMAFGFNFELFTHITRFCGQKVVLLGLYNGQGLHHEPEEDMVTYSRTTQGLNPTFVRVLLLRGRMQGAVLIGETELEETFEHLILDGLDLTRYGSDLLAPDVELEMIFD
ncbi:hypothetical protein WJX82_009836 [Trebouxia sp. C0006]